MSQADMAWLELNAVTRCANPAHLPTSEKQRDAIEKAERQLEYTQIMLDIDYPQQADRHVNTWGQIAIEEANDPAITARAEKLRAEIEAKYAAKRKP